MNGVTIAPMVVNMQKSIMGVGSLSSATTGAGIETKRAKKFTIPKAVAQKSVGNKLIVAM